MPNGRRHSHRRHKHHHKEGDRVSEYDRPSEYNNLLPITYPTHIQRKCCDKCPSNTEAIIFSCFVFAKIKDLKHHFYCIVVILSQDQIPLSDLHVAVLALLKKELSVRSSNQSNLRQNDRCNRQRPFFSFSVISDIYHFVGFFL